MQEDTAPEFSDSLIDFLEHLRKKVFSDIYKLEFFLIFLSAGIKFDFAYFFDQPSNHALCSNFLREVLPTYQAKQGRRAKSRVTS